MRFSRNLCCLICVLILLFMTSCTKNTSSNVEVIYEEYESSINSDSTSDETVISSQVVSTDSITITEPQYKPDFSEIRYMDYVCTQDIPGYDAIYTVNYLMTDNGQNIALGSDYICDIEGVTTEGNKIIIPYEVRNATDQILITARHRASGISEIFDITFEGNWSLSFEDNFDGNEIDTTVWKHRPERLRDRTYANFWSNDLTFLDGEGNMVSRAYISSDIHTDGRQIYYSGAVGTSELLESSYGYYEARVKPHNQTGMWGSVWIVAGDMSDFNARNDNLSLNGVELDIFETCKIQNYVAHGVAWDGFGEHKKSGGSINGVTRVTEDLFDGNYHTFGLRWTPEEYIFYVDGKESCRTIAVGGACNKPGYLYITTECDNKWFGDITLDVGEHSDMLVDYVKIYTNSAEY